MDKDLIREYKIQLIKQLENSKLRKSLSESELESFMDFITDMTPEQLSRIFPTEARKLLIEPEEEDEEKSEEDEELKGEEQEETIDWGVQRERAKRQAKGLPLGPLHSLTASTQLKRAKELAAQIASKKAVAGKAPLP